MTKRVCAVLLLAAVALSLVACGSSKEDVRLSSEEVTYTRGEWIHELVKLHGYSVAQDEGEGAEPSFTDIADSEYRADIEAAVAHGVIAETGGAFHPDDVLTTREFAVYTAVRSLDSSMDGQDKLECEDAEDIEYAQEVALALELGMLELEDGMFHPQRALHIDEGTQILKALKKQFGFDRFKRLAR